MIKISELPAASALGGTEVVAGVQGGVTAKILISAIGTYVRGLFTTTPATIAEGGTGAASAGAARTALGLAIGSDVQAYDADIPTSAASQVEMETGTEAALRSMSPLRIAQAIAALTPAVATVPTGVSYPYFGTTAPTGYVMASGRTIGSATSGGTERANADTEDLYVLLWDSMTNTEAPVSGGRGASAAADFAANKTLQLPDARGRGIAGKDDMGGSAASRLTTAASGVAGATLGASGGAQTHTLTTAQLATHGHSVSGNTTINYGTSVGGSTGLLYDTTTVGVIGTVPITGTAANNGSGDAHNNVQPVLIANMIIKL